MKFMIEKLLVTIIILSGIVFLIGLIGSYFDSEEQATPISNLTISKTAFVKIVLDWCHIHIPNTIKNKPDVVVKYYKTKNTFGIYNSSNNSIVIYVHNHQTVEHLINTIIHEYIHARQRNRSFTKMYDQYTRDRGYWDNPFEIEARQEAAKYQTDCMSYFKKYYI